MKNYLKLLDFEMKRAWKFYFAILGSAMLLECFVVFSLSKQAAEFNSHDIISFSYTVGGYIEHKFLFYLPILYCIVALSMYVLFTWYREWYGKHTFIYQLLLLPGDRMSIFFAKLTAILMMVLGCLVAQIAIFPVLVSIYRGILGSSAEPSTSLVSWINGDGILGILLPGNVPDFLFAYGAGTTAVIVLFTMVLVERSYRYKGIAAALIYGFLVWETLKIPKLIGQFIPLYNNEYVSATIGAYFVVIAVSLIWSRHLINKKIWV